MAERPVINTSPLVFLTRAGRLPLLRILADRIVVPRPVMEEISAKGPNDVTVRAVTDAGWMDIVDPPSIPSIIQAWDLGHGEASVLAWGQAHPGTEVIIDDLLARRCAAALGIPVRGTLGLVLVAKQRGTIVTARPVIDQLRQAGMYLSNHLVDQVLSLVGE